MINRAMPEMLHYRNMSENTTGNATDMTVLERQQTQMKWQQEQVHHQPQQEEDQKGYYGENEYSLFSMANTLTQAHQIQELINGDSVLEQFVNHKMKIDPDFENGWESYDKFPMTRTGFNDQSLGFDQSCGYSDGINIPTNYEALRTTSCPQKVAEAMVETVNAASGAKGGEDSVLTATGKQSFKKRKADKVAVEDDNRGKKIKKWAKEGDSKITELTSSKINNNNREASGDTSKENSKVSEVQKPDYIHVRARRGQATDSHSLAERVRREKISERMKYLQDLVPGCNKITGKAGMLDEIINYVQSLQRQVEFLSMKLANVNSRFELSIDNIFANEVFPVSTSSYPLIELASKLANPTTSMQFNTLQQVGINAPDMGLLRRTISAPISAPEAYLDTSCFTQIQQTSTCDADLQNIYNFEVQQVGRASPFPSQPFTGAIEASNIMMGM